MGGGRRAVESGPSLGGVSLLSPGPGHLLWISMTFSIDRTALALGLCCKTFSGRGSIWGRKKNTR